MSRDVGRIVVSKACVDEGARWLAAREPAFARALAEVGELPLRRKPDGFRALLDAIVGQQISIAAANGIWQRMQAAGLCSAAGIRRADDATLRACGLSRQKIRYARELAGSKISYRALRQMPDAQVIAQLVEIKGIGTWTAEIYAKFALGRADVFAAGDLALQEAARVLFDLPGRPSEREMRALAGDWSPWRSVAARILWSYYRVIKAREGAR